MPHFSANGNDTYICQKCARILDSVDYPSEWRPDITGHQSAGNVCPSCVRAFQQEGNQHLSNLQRLSSLEPQERPMSLHEYCRQESGGLEGLALERYINRYYGHG